MAIRIVQNLFPTYKCSYMLKNSVFFFTFTALFTFPKESIEFSLLHQNNSYEQFLTYIRLLVHFMHWVPANFTNNWIILSCQGMAFRKSWLMTNLSVMGQVVWGRTDLWAQQWKRLSGAKEWNGDIWLHG